MSHTGFDTPASYLNDSTRQYLREQTKEPVSWETGAQYDHPHGDLNAYQEFRSVARAKLNKAEATQVLVDFLTPRSNLSKSEKAALNRLNSAAHRLNWDPSLVIKALPDLDVAFFDGRLRGNVIAVWATEKEIVESGCDGRKPGYAFKGLCQPLESEENEGEQRCKVWLNSDLIFNTPDPRLQMWETMFHELVHAYAVISSDPKFFLDYRALGDPYHDGQFDYLLSMVDRRSMNHMRMSAKPAGEGHTICLNCHPRPLMHGDEEFGMDEQEEMLRAQASDPRWDQGPD